MSDGRAALLFLYGLFWAEILATSARYNGFPTAALWTGDDHAGRYHQWRRLLVSILLLNLFPTAWLGVLYAWVVPDAKGAVPVAMAAIASLSAFGIIRIYHGVVASTETIDAFYTATEQSLHDIQGKGKVRTHWSHIVPGVLYLIAFPAAAIILGRLR